MANQIKITFILALFAVNFAASQSINFFKTYGGNGYDYGNGVVQLPDSSYAVTGSSSSFAEAPSQAFILRVDSLGNYIWSLNYGGSKSDIGRRIFYSPTQGYWIAGYSNSFNTPANFDFYLIKTDTAGTMQWQKTYGTGDLEQMWDAVMLPDSGLVMVGSSVGDSSLNEDIYMVRTNFFGDTVWTKHLRTPKSDIAYTCFLMDDTTVIVGGKSSNTIDSLTGYLASFDIDGTLNWQNFYGAQGEATVMDLDTFDNTIYVVGGITLYDSTHIDHWQINTDKQGNFIKDNIDSRPKDDYVNQIVSRNNLIYISAWTETTDFNLFPGGPDLVLVNYDNNYFWGGFSVFFSGLDPDECHQIIRTSDGGLMMVGFASDFHFTEGGSDITLIKIGANDEYSATVNGGNTLVGIKQDENKSIGINAFPNPTEGILYINSKSTEVINYRLIDIQGQVLQKGILQKSIDLNKLKKGIYFLRLSSLSETHTIRIMKR